MEDSIISYKKYVYSPRTDQLLRKIRRTKKEMLIYQKEFADKLKLRLELILKTIKEGKMIQEQYYWPGADDSQDEQAVSKHLETSKFVKHYPRQTSGGRSVLVFEGTGNEKDCYTLVTLSDMENTTGFAIKTGSSEEPDIKNLIQDLAYSISAGLLEFSLDDELLYLKPTCDQEQEFSI